MSMPAAIAWPSIDSMIMPGLMFIPALLSGPSFTDFGHLHAWACIRLVIEHAEGRRGVVGRR